MTSPTVLLLASHHSLADRVTTLLRANGYEVVPGWFNDARRPPLDGTPVDLVLVDLRHHAARSPAFTRMAAQLGVAIVYFSVEPPEGPEIIAELGGADGSAPVLPLADDETRFVDALRRLFPPEARRQGAP